MSRLGAIEREIHLEDLSEASGVSVEGLRYRGHKLGCEIVRARVSAADANRMVNFWNDKRSFTSPPWLDDFFAEVKEAMIDTGMDTKDLADATGYSERMIYKYLNGECVPTIPCIESIAKALDEKVVLCLNG